MHGETMKLIRLEVYLRLTSSAMLRCADW